MSGINDNVKLLYDALKKEGYGNLGSVEQFDGLLKDSGNREYLYKSMKDEGFSDLGEYSEFESMLGYQMPEDLKQSKGVLRSDINPEPVNLRPEYTGPTQEQPDYVNPLTNSPEYNFESIKQKGKIETVTPNDPYENIFQSISDNRTGLDDAIKDAMKGNVREGVRPIDVSTNLIAARDYLNEAEELINAKKEGAGLFRGIANAFTNRRTWDFGMSDFATNKSVKNAIDKFEKGDELSDDETRLLDALAVNTAAKVYASDMGYGYDIGSGFVQSIPFMIEMAINPLSGSGKAIGKKLASYAAKRFAGNAGNILGKVGRVAGDVAGSTAMAATTGAPGVAADYYARSTGTPVVSSDFGDISLGQVAMDPFGNVIKNENGENMMIGSVGKESDAKAMYKALAARSIDNFSEMFGAYFGPIGDAIKNSRLGKRLSVSAVGKKLDQLTTEDWVKSFNSLLKDAKYDGFIGETAEEYVGGLINSVMVGDQSLSDLASLDNLIRTAGTVGLMSGIFGSVNLAGVRTAKYKAGKDLENSENRIFDSVGEEEFDDFINKMDSSDPDKRADIIRDIIKSDKYDNIQKAMFMDYYHKRMVYDGFVYGQAKKNQEGKPTEEDQEASDDTGTSQSNMSQGRQSFEQMSEESRNVGRNMTSRDEMYAASNDMKAKRNDLESMDSGLAQTIDNYIKDGASYNEVTGLMEGLPADLRSKAEAYYQSQMVVTGAQEKVLDDIDQKVQQMESNSIPYIKTSEDGTRIFTSAYYEEGLSHDIVYIMEEQGDKAVIYQNGQKKMVDSARLSYKKDQDLDMILEGYREFLIEISQRKLDLYMNHNPKTSYPEPGLVVFNGKDAFILQGQDENGDWSAFPAVFDKETGQVTAKANGTPSILTEREILELQDNAYASQDLPVNEQVQQEQQPDQIIKTSEIEGKNATSPSSGESNVSQETPQSDLDRVIASLPKKKDGSIDYKAMTPMQQYDYTSASEGPETALADLQQDIEAKRVELSGIEDKIAKATGGDRAALRDQARAKRKEYEELTAFYNSVAPAPASVETIQEVQEPVQAVETQEAPVAESSTEVEATTTEKAQEEPVSRTVNEEIEDLFDGSLDNDEIDQLVDANIKEAEKALGKIKKPAVGADKAAYLEKKKEYEAKREAAQAVVDHWNDVKAQIANNRAGVEQQAIPDLEEIGEPLNAHELAAEMLANGSIKLTRDSYMQETGFGDQETKGMFGLFASPEKGGVSVERAGEILTQADSEGGYNFIDPNEPNAGRDVIIDVLSQAKTRGDLINYIKRRREEMANRERQAAYNDYAKWTQDNFGMTPEEWEAYNDAVDRDIRSIGITDEELRAIDGEIYDDMLAEQQDYAEIYGQLNQQQDETNQGNEQGRDQEPGEGGGEVLPTEQPVETGRDGVVEREREAGDDVNRQDDGAQEGEGKSIKENDTVRFRFIGERGAYNLDQAEEATTRMDNLNVARNMENAHNDKKRRIEKLKTSKPVEITGNEIEPSDDLKQYKKNALEYGKRLRGEYTNKDTGVTVMLSSGNKNGGLKEVLQHDINDIAHLKSVAAIPGILENSIYIETVENEEVEKNPNVSRYHYYVCGLKIGDTDYTVKAVVAEQNNGNRYYDHKLTEIEKGKLLDELAQLNQTSPSGLSSTGELEETEQSRPAASRGETQSSPVSQHKDTRLMSILKTNDEENARKIKMATGWERGADGKWRYETPDFSFKENPVVVPFDGYVLTNLGALINDEELFKAYPELEDMTVQYQNLPLGMLASYSPKTNRFPAMITMDNEFIRKKENPEWRKLVEKMEQEPVIKKWIEEMEREPFDEAVYNKAEKDFKESPLWEKYNDLLLGKGKVPRYVSGFSGEKILAHEIQHAIQDIEGFAKGGNTRNTQYNNFAGEVESRNVEKRFDLSPEGRSATLAEETEDVAREDQIFINNALNNNKLLFYEPNTRNNQSKEAGPEANREDSRARTETVEANGNIGAQDNTPVGSTGRETAEANDGVYNGDRVNGQQTGNYDRASDQGTGRENRPANGDIDGQDGQRAVGYDAGRGEQGQRDIDSGERNNLGNIQPGDNRGTTDNGDRGTNNVDQRVDGESDRAGDIDQGGDRFIRAANDTALSLGTTVRIINNIDELPDGAIKEALSQGRKITGWYDIASGQVYVYAPNLTSENEAKKTVLHEAVAHKGLRQVIGNDAYNKEMVKLFDKLPEDEKMEVSRMAQERYGGDTAVAMDEYLAEKAELDETPSFWEKVVSSVRRMLRKVGIDMSLNEGDVKYLLWRGRKSLNEKDPFEVAKDLVMRSKNGIGQKGQTRMREARTEVEQSSPTGGSTTRAWDDLVSSDAYLMEESLFDYLLSVDKFQKLITGKDKSKVLDYENAYHALLEVSSVNRSEMDIFDASLLSSLNEAISKLVGKRKRKWKWESGPERDLVKYVEAKHGIERNRDLAVRDGMASLREMPLERLVSSGIMSKEEYKSFSDKVNKEAEEEARKFKDKIMPQIIERESRKEGMTEEGAREIAEKESERRAAKVKETYIKKAEAELKEDKIKSINDRWVRGRAEIRSKNMSWENKQKSLDNLAKSLSWKDKFGSFGVKLGKDYSGLSSVFKDDADTENTGWDERAREFVKSYEESHDQESIKGLWDSVKKITDFSLWKQRQSGLVDQQYVNDNMDRFEYFVPLRGFNDEIASDVYQYFGDGQSLAGNPVKSASGRMSEADNPFSGMLSVAYASIASGNKNITKQKFLNFVRNHDTDGLVTVNNIWIRNVGTEENPDWQEVAPEIPDNATSEEVAKAVNDFEAQMEELAEQGLAEKIKGGKSRIPYKTLGRQRNEHQVQVLVGGNRYVLTVNGNPRVAQAINGLMNPDVNMNGFFEYGKRIQVFMAGMFTSKNVAFSMVNLTRDLSYSNVMTFINEDFGYFTTFTKNQAKLVKDLPKIGKMLYDYNRGELNPKDKLSTYFKEFMDNGGATGYTFIESQREYSGKLAKMLDRLSEGNLSNMNPAKWTRLMFDMFEFMGNTTEILNRLAAYETSRENGRSVSRSIMDAKEVTVNFSRKGAGIKSVNKDTRLLPRLVAYTSQFGRSYILFWNASLQGKRKLFKSAMNHPIKTGSTFVAAPICMGMAVPLLNNVFLPALYNMVGNLFGLGGDDEYDDYFDVLSDYQRQNNICIRLPKGYWLKLPLSPDLAIFYGLGDKLQAHLSGKRDLKVMDGVEAITDVVSPIGINWNYQGTALALNVLPTVFQPLAQTMMNTNFMGNPIKKESFTRSSELDPEYTKVYKSASSSLVELSKLTNDLSGGDAIRSGSVNWNPAILQNLLTGYTGGFGTVALGIADAIVDASKGDTQGISATRYPLLSRFVAGGDPEVNKRRINSNYQTVVVDFVNKIMHDYDGYQKQLEDPTLNALDYAEYQKKLNDLYNSDDLMKAMELQNYIDKITDINKMIKEFGDNESLDKVMYELMLEAIDIKRDEK